MDRWRASVLLAVIVSAPAAATVSAVIALPSREQWLSFAILAGLGLIQEETCTAVERTRRLFAVPMPVTMTSVWMMAAALTLPVSLITALSFVLYGHTFVRSWRGTEPVVANRAAYTAAIVTWSAAAAHLALFLGAGSIERFDVAQPRNTLLAILAVAVYMVANLVGAAAGLAIRGEYRFLDMIKRPGGTNLVACNLILGVLTGMLLLERSWFLAGVALVAIALHRASLTRQVEDQAATDPKTGVRNSAAWQLEATRELTRARRQAGQCSILMIDLDHFKQINDTYGHPAGDRVLWQLGHVLRANARAEDIPARFGGEEFVVLLPKVGAPEAAAIAHRLRAAIAAMTVEATDTLDQAVHITNRTASIGIATYPDDGDTVEAILARADHWCYVAKQHGRNRVAGGSAPPYSVAGEEGQRDELG
ncbi:GGDEF domain-containing protein [Sciscionella sediminilitoris]|uniref:GGDEF domain-containing protein n=1 Tax=Sciscionella sediminilitoris TaxID=1445613 RepID=UPI0012E21998|nr:GGDEF domain-containing protein [Sciscionella sp. SE31]